MMKCTAECGGASTSSIADTHWNLDVLFSHKTIMWMPPCHEISAMTGWTYTEKMPTHHGKWQTRSEITCQESKKRPFRTSVLWPTIRELSAKFGKLCMGPEKPRLCLASSSMNIWRLYSPNLKRTYRRSFFTTQMRHSRHSLWICLGGRSSRRC